MQAGRLITVLCVLLIPGTLARHLGEQEAAEISTRLRSTRKSQRSKTVVSEVRKTHLSFRQAPPALLTTTEYGSAVLECEAGGNPPPTIHWLKNGRRLQPQQDREEQAEVDAPIGVSVTRSRLYLDCLVSGDQATYSCVAENPYKRMNSDTKLIVRTPDMVSDETTTSELCLSKKAFGSPARIQMWTHSRLEEQGNDALLFCRTVGQPQPNVLWIGPEEKSISSGNKYQVFPSGDLLIRNLVWEDMGKYLCLVENDRGADKTATFVYPAAKEKRT